MRISWFFFGISIGFLGFGSVGCDTSQDGIEMDEVSTWISISGGQFLMGDSHLASSGPVHNVYVPTFKVLRTEVTVAQYTDCVNAGGCTLPGTDEGCAWGKAGFDQYPINCVTWQQAADFCSWFGGADQRCIG